MDGSADCIFIQIKNKKHLSEKKLFFPEKKPLYQTSHSNTCDMCLSRWEVLKNETSKVFDWNLQLLESCVIGSVRSSAAGKKRQKVWLFFCCKLDLRAAGTENIANKAQQTTGLSLFTILTFSSCRQLWQLYYIELWASSGTRVTSGKSQQQEWVSPFKGKTMIYRPWVW